MAEFDGGNSGGQTRPEPVGEEVVSGPWRWDAAVQQWVPRWDPGVVPPPPRVGEAGAGGRDVWGIGQAVWGIVFVLVVSTILGIVGVLASNPDVFTSGDPGELEEAALSTNWFLATVAVGALSFTAWVVLVARRKRLDLAVDLGWGLERSDLKFTAGLVVAGFFLDFGLVTLVGAILQPEESDLVLTGAFEGVAGWQWFALFIGIAVITPIGEELFFRGLVLRAVAKRWTPTVGVVVQGVLFMLFHAGNASSLAAMLTTFAGVGALGFLLGWAAVRTGRLGPGIIAHAFINGFVVLVSWAAV